MFSIQVVGRQDFPTGPSETCIALVAGQTQLPTVRSVSLLLRFSAQASRRLVRARYFEATRSRGCSLRPRKAQQCPPDRSAYLGWQATVLADRLG